MATRRFGLFHFSLIAIREPTFEAIRDISREEWVRFCLSEEFDFGHRGATTLHWTPKGTIGELIIGLIQRKMRHAVHRPPHEGGEEAEVEEWQGSYLILDPTTHDQGQRIALEKDVVGTPSALLKSLALHLNARRDAPYQLEIEALFDSQSFWSFAEKHGPLTYVDFHFVVPNMWGTKRALEKELEATREDTGAETVDVKLESEHGVDPKSQRVTEGVEYAEQGAGTVKALAIDGAKYNSSETPVETEVEGPAKGDSTKVEWIKEYIRKILGQE